MNARRGDDDDAQAVQPEVQAKFGGGAAYYSDYRYQRRPLENLTLGRIFQIKERAALSIRAEFTNVFNRTEMNSPTATNALATPQGRPQRPE